MSKHNDNFEERLSKATRKDMVAVAPGADLYQPSTPETTPPEYVLARFTRRPDGKYRCIPQQFRFARVNEDLMRLLGFGTAEARPVQYQTLRRLANAGFIDMIQISPGVWMLDIDSYYRHLRYCFENPDIWEPGSEDRKTYLFRNNLGEYKGSNR